jgi:colanic acid/amylovoran biosynthesis glycosyltransferase
LIRPNARSRLATRARPRPIHLVEVGVRWPPETFLQLKFERLTALGFRVTVISVASHDDARVHVKGARLVRLPAPGEHRLGVWGRVIWKAVALLVTRPARLRAIVAALRSSVPSGPQLGAHDALARLPAFLPAARLRPDVVHFEWPWRARYYFPLVDVWKRPFTISCRSGHYEVPAHTSEARIVPLLFAKAAAVHCVCHALERAMAQHALPHEKSWVIRTAVDEKFFRPNDRNGDVNGAPFGVVSVGRLAWYKGYEYALIAVRRLLDLGVPVRFDIVGEGPDRARIVHAVSDLDLEEHVRLHGHLGPELVRERLRAADVFLQASVAEGLPNAVLEAMACALPVVVTDCGGLREAVTDGIEGFVVPRRAPGPIADKLHQLARDPVLRTTMGAAGRARVQREFTLADQTMQFAELYESVATRSGRSA